MRLEISQIRHDKKTLPEALGITKEDFNRAVEEMQLEKCGTVGGVVKKYGIDEWNLISCFIWNSKVSEMVKSYFRGRKTVELDKALAVAFLACFLMEELEKKKRRRGANGKN